MATPYHGPTVSEYADIKLRQLNRIITEAQYEIGRWKKLMAEYAGSSMLYAELMATKSEPFQTTQLPNRPDLADMDYVFPKEENNG